MTSPPTQWRKKISNNPWSTENVMERGCECLKIDSHGVGVYLQKWAKTCCLALPKKGGTMCYAWAAVKERKLKRQALMRVQCEGTISLFLPVCFLICFALLCLACVPIFANIYFIIFMLNSKFFKLRIFLNDFEVWSNAFSSGLQTISQKEKN